MKVAKTDTLKVDCAITKKVNVFLSETVKEKLTVPFL